MSTVTTDYISRLSDITDSKRWIERQIFAVKDAAQFLISPPFSMGEMAVGVFEDPDSDACYGAGNCPVDATGAHARQIMEPHLVGEFVGHLARKRVVDGLSPEDIRFLKAHTAARTNQSNRDAIATGSVSGGDTRSYGAVNVIVILPGAEGRFFSFIVASSGSTAWKDHQLSATVAERIIANLIGEGHLPDFAVVSKTFVLEADPFAVNAHTIRPHPQKEAAN